MGQISLFTEIIVARIFYHSNKKENSDRNQAFKVWWWWILCTKLARIWCPIIWSNSSLGVAGQVSSDVVNISSKLSIMVSPPQLGWVSSKSLKAWREKLEFIWEGRNSDTGIPSGLKWQHQLLPDSPASQQHSRFEICPHPQRARVLKTVSMDTWMCTQTPKHHIDSMSLQSPGYCVCMYVMCGHVWYRYLCGRYQVSSSIALCFISLRQGHCFV